MKTAIVGGGKGCQAILEMILDMKLAIFCPEILAVVDVDDNAPGMVFAREWGFRTLTDLETALALPGLELIIELVGSDDFLEELYRMVPKGVRILDHVAGRVFWDLESATSQLQTELEAKNRLQNRLIQDRNQLQQVLDSIPDVVLVIDADNRLEWVNARLNELTGLTSADIVKNDRFNDPFCSPPPDQDKTGYVCSLEEVKKTRRPVQFIHFDPGQGLGDDQAYYRIVVTPIFDRSGKLVKVVETARPITEIVLRSRETEESERRFRQFVDNAHDIITMKDLEGRYLIINRPAADLFHMSPMDCIGRTDHELVPERLADIITARDRETLSQRSHTHCEETLFLNGQRRYLDTVRFPLINYRGDLAGVCSISRDVTEQRDLQNAFLQTEKLAAVGKLAAGVAHEINNPLTGVLTFAEEMRMDLQERDPDSPLTSDLNLIIRETMRCRGIVAKLLDYARLERPTRQTFDVNRIIGRALGLIRRQADFHDIDFEVDLAQALPEVSLDPGQIQQVLLNLIINATEAMDRTGRIVIFSELCKDGQSVAVTVADQGPGIPDSIREQIFEPFFSTKGEKGNGLGLSVVKTIIDQHDGQIRVDSKPGQGASFIIELPAAQRP